MWNPFILCSSASHTTCLLVRNRGKWFVWSRHEGKKIAFAWVCSSDKYIFLDNLVKQLHLKKDQCILALIPIHKKIHINTSERRWFNCISWCMKAELWLLISLASTLQLVLILIHLHFWDCVESLDLNESHDWMLKIGDILVMGPTFVFIATLFPPGIQVFCTWVLLTN